MIPTSIFPVAMDALRDWTWATTFACLAAVLAGVGCVLMLIGLGCGVVMFLTSAAHIGIKLLVSGLVMALAGLAIFVALGRVEVTR